MRTRPMTAMSTTSKATIIATVTLVAIFLALAVAKVFWVGFYHVPKNGMGMYPTLLPGDRFFTAKRAYSDASSVARGDIIVFVVEENGLLYNYFWRVIGLPGEKIESSGELLSIDGQPVHHQRVRETDGSTIYREQIGDVTHELAYATLPRSHPPDVSITIPADHFFVMGDNRFEATDSRYLGTIPFSSIIGKKL
jgi:signal peptidase I